VAWRARYADTGAKEQVMSFAYVEDIKAALADFYTPEEAEQWLDAPHPQLGWISARLTIEDGRKSEVWDIINRLRDCVYL
jgi:uncharacterized protein (DUF2384 family)